ncbi:MAG: phosphoribosylamine--glycine ligase [Treponema sp.]|nr:phosphoribosylamine--glycine ligase [Treponema sp.]
MKVLVVGNGGREHAIAWKLAQSNLVESVVCVPGNGGTAFEDKCVNVDISQTDYIQNRADKNGAYVQVAKHEGCEFAVIGPENPLAEGIADAFWKAGIPTVGAKYDAAQLEASKDLAKDFMNKYGVACAKSRTFTDEKEALAYVEKEGAPIVIKADGLAAGKGVVVAKTLDDAKNAVVDLMENHSVGEAGNKLVIEEYLTGDEISILAAVSVTPEFAKEGKAVIVPFQSARDHKRLCDGAKGPNTGGMGAISPVSDVTPEILEQFNKNILEPTLKGLIAEKYDYRGFIFFGLMLTKDGPKCLEYNVRLGDPETQAVLPLMDFDFAKMCKAITDGSLKDFKFAWKKGFVVAPVAVSGGYPREYQKGIPILMEKDRVAEIGAKVFIAGAIADRRHPNPIPAGSTGLVTSGGRVLACSCYSDTFEAAWKGAYSAMEQIKFENMFYRKDIGLPGAAKSE